MAKKYQAMLSFSRDDVLVVHGRHSKFAHSWMCMKIRSISANEVCAYNGMGNSQRALGACCAKLHTENAEFSLKSMV